MTRRRALRCGRLGHLARSGDSFTNSSRRPLARRRSGGSPRGRGARSDVSGARASGTAAPASTRSCRRRRGARRARAAAGARGARASPRPRHPTRSTPPSPRAPRPWAGGRAPSAARRRGAWERAPAAVGSRPRPLAKNRLTTQHVVVYAPPHTIPGRGLMAREPVGEVLDGGLSGAEAGPAPGRRGLAIARQFTTAGTSPFDEVEWEIRAAVIQGEGGETVFEQRDVEVPRRWSQLATNVVVSKYFRGPLGSPARERSVRQPVARVANTIGGCGAEQ